MSNALMTLGNKQSIVAFDESALFAGIEGEAALEARPFLNIMQEDGQVPGCRAGDLVFSFGGGKNVIGRGAAGRILYIFGTRSGWGDSPNKRSFRKAMIPRSRDVKDQKTMRKVCGGPMLCGSRSGLAPDPRYYTADRKNLAAPDKPMRIIDWRIQEKQETVLLPTRWGGDKTKTTTYRRYIDIDANTQCWNCQLAEWVNRINGAKGEPPICQAAPRALLWIESVAGVDDWVPQQVWYEASGKASSRLFYGGSRDEAFRKKTKVKPIQWFTHFKNGSVLPNFRVVFGNLSPVYLPLVISAKQWTEVNEEEGTQDQYFLPHFTPLWEEIATPEDMVKQYARDFAKLGADVEDMTQVLSAAMIVKMRELAMIRWEQGDPQDVDELAVLLAKMAQDATCAPTIGHNPQLITLYTDEMKAFQEKVTDEAGAEVYRGVMDTMYPREAQQTQAQAQAKQAAQAEEMDFSDDDEVEDDTDWSEEDELLAQQDDEVEVEVEDEDEDDFSDPDGFEDEDDYDDGEDFGGFDE